MNNTLIAAYRTWRKYRRTFNVLNRLSERELEDVGITRRDLLAVARESARGY